MARDRAGSTLPTPNNRLELLRLRRVCKRWAIIIEDILEKLEFWQLLCADDIKPWTFAIFEKLFPHAIKRKQRILHQKTWKKIYLSYQKWRTQLKFPYSYTVFNFVQIFSADERITCIDTWVDYLAVGSSTGKIYFFKTENFPQLILTGSHGNRPIANIKFWYTETKKLIAVVSLENQSLEFWDVENRQRMISPLENQPSVAIACKGHRLYIADINGILECKWNNNELSRGNEVEFETSTNIETVQSVKIIGISANWTKLIVVRSDFDYLFIVSLKIPTTTNLNFTTLPEESFVVRMEPTQNNEFICYIPMNDVIFVINGNKVYVSINQAT